jgi:hypothetical protein
LKLAANVTSSRAGFHTDQAARNVGQPALKLSARALQLQNDRPALIEADKMEAILAEIDADRADGRVDVLLVLLNPSQDFTSRRAGARPGHPISRLNPLYSIISLALALQLNLRIVATNWRSFFTPSAGTPNAAN